LTTNSRIVRLRPVAEVSNLALDIAERVAAVAVEGEVVRGFGVGAAVVAGLAGVGAGREGGGAAAVEEVEEGGGGGRGPEGWDGGGGEGGALGLRREMGC
jgi:hypothetical protein